METKSRLSLAEQLLMLSYLEEKGRISYRASGTLQYSLAALSLLELCMKKKVQAEGRKVVLLDMSPTGDVILDEMLAKIADKNDPKAARHWIALFSQRLTRKLLDRLVDKGVFWEDYVQFLFIFNRKSYRLTDGGKWKELRDRVREVLLKDSVLPVPEEMLLIAMLKITGLLPLYLSKDEIKTTREKVKRYLKDEGFAKERLGCTLAAAYKTVRKALEEIRSANSAA